MSDAVKAHGTRLQRGDGASPEAFTDIAEVTSVGGPSLALEPLDVTHHLSTEGWREFKGGLLDGGEVSLELNFLPANATQNGTAGLVADMKNRTLRNFKLIFPDTGSTTWNFAGLVTAFEPSAPVDDKLSASVTIKVSGQPTLV